MHMIMNRIDADFIAWLRSDSFKAAHSDREAPGMDTSSAIEQYEEIGTIAG